jgi:hypothetical protein
MDEDREGNEREEDCVVAWFVLSIAFLFEPFWYKLHSSYKGSTDPDACICFNGRFNARAQIKSAK